MADNPEAALMSALHSWGLRHDQVVHVYVEGTETPESIGPVYEDLGDGRQLRFGWDE